MSHFPSRFLLLPLLACATPCLAQQLPEPTMYRYHNFYFNPAYAGVEEKKTLGLTYRKDCAPSDTQAHSGIISFDMPIDKSNSGIGAVLAVQNAGAFTTGRLGIGGSYNLHFSEYGNLRLGGRLTATRLDIDYEKIVYSPGAPQQAGSDSEQRLDADAGLWLSYRGLFIGAAMENLFRAEFGFTDNTRYLQPRHVYATAGFKFDRIRNLEITPSVLVRQARTLRSNQAIDLNLNLVLWERLIAGGTYRPTENITFPLSGYAGLQFERVQLLLAADVPDQGLPGRDCGPNYEALLRFRF